MSTVPWNGDSRTTTDPSWKFVPKFRIIRICTEVVCTDIVRHMNDAWSLSQASWSGCDKFRTSDEAGSRDTCMCFDDYTHVMNDVTPSMTHRLRYVQHNKATSIGYTQPWRRLLPLKAVSHQLHHECDDKRSSWSTIRYDTIEEFNVDSKAEYTA